MGDDHKLEVFLQQHSRTTTCSQKRRRGQYKRTAAAQQAQKQGEQVCGGCRVCKRHAWSRRASMIERRASARLALLSATGGASQARQSVSASCPAQELRTAAAAAASCGGHLGAAAALHRHRCRPGHGTRHRRDRRDRDNFSGCECGLGGASWRQLGTHLRPGWLWARPRPGCRSSGRTFPPAPAG